MRCVLVWAIGVVLAAWVVPSAARADAASDGKSGKPSTSGAPSTPSAPSTKVRGGQTPTALAPPRPLLANDERTIDAITTAARTKPRGVEEALFDVSVGFELGMRHFDYTDRITQSLRSYELSGVPLIAAGGDLYPLASIAHGILQDVGVAASYRQAVGLESATSGGAAASTSWSELSVGGRLRLRPGGGPRPAVVYLGVDYDATTFELTTADPALAAGVPSVAYRALRLGGDARVPLGPIALLGGLGYHAVMDAGPVSDRFPHSSEGGVDARLGIAVPLFQGLEARALATYRRYFYDFSPQPGDRFVAGGALDQFAMASVGVTYAR